MRTPDRRTHIHRLLVPLRLLLLVHRCVPANTSPSLAMIATVPVVVLVVVVVMAKGDVDACACACACANAGRGGGFVVVGVAFAVPAVGDAAASTSSSVSFSLPFLVGGRCASHGRHGRDGVCVARGVFILRRFNRRVRVIRFRSTTTTTTTLALPSPLFLAKEPSG